MDTKINTKWILAGALGLALLALGLWVSLGGVQKALSGFVESPSVTPGKYRYYSFFATTTGQTWFATTTTATSTNITPWTDTNTGAIDNGYFVIAGARTVNLFFGRAGTVGANVGTTTFKVQVSQDASNWHDYNQLEHIRAVTTGDTYFTRVANTSSGASATNVGAATSTTLYKMDNKGYYALRCIVVETTDGEHSCAASAEF